MDAEFLERVKRIAADNVSSAHQIVRDALEVVADYCDGHPEDADFRPGLSSLLTELAAAQPQMASLSNICRIVTSRSGKLSPAGMKEYVSLLETKVSESSSTAARAAAKFIVDGGTYATLSQSELVTKTFLFAAEERKTVRVYVMESRPLFEGRQTARALKKGGHSPVLISDASIGLFVDEIDSAFVGADAILANGTVVNKVGSLSLAALCAAAGKNFYVVTSVLKYDSRKMPADFANKEQSADEILANAGFEVRNLYFDLIRPDLVTAIITEAGIHSAKTGLSQLDSSMRDLFG